MQYAKRMTVNIINERSSARKAQTGHRQTCQVYLMILSNFKNIMINIPSLMIYKLMLKILENPKQGFENQIQLSQKVIKTSR
mgnify:CR=1 FL=1